MSTFAIGQLAKHAGVGIDTVRYYERAGLLRPATRTAAGYRTYGESELKRLRFIRRAKALGFTLEQINELLAVSGQRDVRAVRRAAQDKLVDIDTKLVELQRIRDALAQLVNACPGHGPVIDCPILHALTQEDPS